MNKFFGEIGYTISEEVRPSVWMPKLVKQNYYGDVIKENRRRDTADLVNDKVRLSVRISIVADENLIQNASNIKYVEYLGTKWNVSDVEPAHPRLILALGDVYTGCDDEELEEDEE